MIELWKWDVLLQAEKMWAKIILNMPNNKKHIAWQLWNTKKIRQYKMFIWNICIDITDEESEYNIKNINRAFNMNEFLIKTFK